jgi:histidinol-phosphate aminotransferase
MAEKNVDVASLLRRDLAEMEEYHPAGLRDGCMLDSNESPWGLPDGMRRRLMGWLEGEEDLNRYPDTDNTALRAAVAKLWKVTPENVTCGVGSDQMIDLICRVFLAPGDCVVTQAPTFGMYSVSAALNHGQAVAVPIGEGSAGIIRAACAERAKIVFICSPNNPTGQVFPQADIRSVLESVNSIVVVDEAYGEFSGLSVIGEIGEYPNLIALRTFSKAYGLAGARVGVAVSSREVIDMINIAKPPFNIPTISQMLAAWAIEESAEYASRARLISVLRDELYERLVTISWIRVERSDANFLYVSSKFDVASVLAENGILARRLPMSGGLYNARVTVGDREENEKVSDALCSAKPK